MLTGARVKDCFDYNEKILFIVNHGDIRKVVANRGSKIKKLEGMIKKKIKVVEYSDDVVEFLRSFISPIKVVSIENVDNIIEIKADDIRNRGILIGRDRRNLVNLKNIVRKYFDVVDIKIV